MLYKEACLQLQNLPKPEPAFEKVSVIFAGLPKSSLLEGENRDVYVASIAAGDNDEFEKIETFTMRRSEAVSWFDFYSKYLDKLQAWMKFVGLGRSHYRLLVVDTRKPLSVLVLAAISQFGKNTIVFAVTADQTSTLIEQNNSYAAISTALKKGFPVVAASASYLDDLIFYTENDGLVVRSQALMPVLHLLVSSIDTVTDMLGNDVRLGVREHCLSAILSASEKVYPSVDDVLYTQESSFSINAKKADIATAYLLAFAPLDVLNRIDKAFAKYRRQELKEVIGADHQGYPRDAGSSSALYDLMMIYGIKEGSTYAPLKKGYDSVASKVPDLRIEKVS